MEFSVAQIATLIKGTVQGDATKKVRSLVKIEEAGEHDLCFISNPKYEHYLYTTSAGAVIINNDLELKQEVDTTLIRVPDAYVAFAQLMDFYAQQIQNKSKKGKAEIAFIDSSAVVADSAYVGHFSYVSEGASIAEGAQIHPQVFIGKGVKIGKNTILFPGVCVYNHCIIGDNVIIHSGAIIGSDGFGFAPQADGHYKKIPQLGNVIIKDNVEIGSNTTIDRGTMGSTIIEENVKLDNLIQVAHNVVIGKNTVIAAQTGISGSTKIGQQCMIGGQVGIVGHLQIADQSILSARSGISKSVKQPGSILGGYFAFDNKEALRSQAVFKKLPDLLKRLEQLEQIVHDIKSKEE